MRNAIKLGVYAAAGIGVFAVLKRYGVLNDVGRWLSDQVPDDMKRQAAHTTKQVRDRVNEVSEQARERVGEAAQQLRERAEKFGGQIKERGQQAASAASDSVEHFKGKAGWTDGKREETQSSDGSSAPHIVGRGVVR